MLRLPWGSSGRDSGLPLQGARVQSLVRALTTSRAPASSAQTTAGATMQSTVKVQMPPWTESYCVRREKGACGAGTGLLVRHLMSGENLRWLDNMQRSFTAGLFLERWGGFSKGGQWLSWHFWAGPGRHRYGLLFPTSSPWGMDILLLLSRFSRVWLCATP